MPRLAPVTTATRSLPAISTEQCQHAGVTVQPIVRDLAVAEEPGERDIPEPLADECELGRAVAEHVLASTDAGEVEPALRLVIELIGNAFEHSQEIRAGGGAVALAEDDRHAWLDIGPNRDQLILRVDANQVSHQIIASVGACNRKPSVNEARRTR